MKVACSRLRKERRNGTIGTHSLSLMGPSIRLDDQFTKFCDQSSITKLWARVPGDAVGEKGK